MDNATIDGVSRREEDLYLNAPDPKGNELRSSHLADTYNGSKLAVKFLNASGWGPLLNLGYFELKRLPSVIRGLNHFQQYLVKKSVELLNPQPNESILDLACGNGWTTQFIAQYGSKITGLDLCEAHIKFAQSNFGKAGNISFINGDATQLENVATPNSIDKIHCLEAAFHFGPEGRKALLNSAFHVLKPGGTFVLVDITWRTNYPEQIDDVDPKNSFRETWQMEQFEPFERYTKNARAIGFVERQILDWTKPVMRILDVAALAIFMGQHSLTRKALEIVRSEYSAITEQEWKLLLQELRLSQRVMGHSRYAAYVFTKP
ncbi:MAG TPA: methyltransferase domain-containing protein [Bryobacteraceae bacterium]|jgi:cyclopropane fatty-acyl-phospholipid synthase-like methyltransferase